MIENPYDWIDDFVEYVIEPNDPQYGSLVIIADNAPEKAKESFRKYIHLISHAILSWGGFMLRNGVIVEDEETMDEWGKIQFAMFEKLVKQGYIKNDPYCKI